MISATERRRLEATLGLLTEKMTLLTSGKPAVEKIVSSGSLSTPVLEERQRTVEHHLGDLRRQRDDLTQEMGAARSRISVLEARADLPVIRHRIDQAQSDLREATINGVAAWFARKVVADIKDEYERDNQPALIRQASDMARRATREAWRGLKVSEDGSRLEVMWGDSMIVPETSLSAGGRDLLRLAVRMAVADAHGERHQVSLPLICDDPTGQIDSVRTPEVFALLAECSLRRQVIVLTHNEAVVNLAVEAGATPIDITPR